MLNWRHAGIPVHYRVCINDADVVEWNLRHLDQWDTQPDSPSPTGPDPLLPRGGTLNQSTMARSATIRPAPDATPNLSGPASKIALAYDQLAVRVDISSPISSLVVQSNLTAVVYDTNYFAAFARNSDLAKFQ